MADNVTLNVGTGGAVLATDDISSVHYQIVKIGYGALDSVTLVTPAAGFPVAQSGTWIIGANSGIDIGDVTINNAAGASAVNIQDGGNSITVDNAGTFAVQAAQAGTWNITNITGTQTLPTGASTLAEQQTQTTALQLLDDTVHSGDAALNKYKVIGAVFDDVAPLTVTENQAHALRMTSTRALHVSVRESLPAGSSAIGSVTVNNAAGGSAVNIQDGGNSITVDGTVTANAGTGNFASTGDVAHDAVDSGNPQKIGGQARNTLPAAVADLDRVNAIFDVVGRQIHYPFAPRTLVSHNRIALTTTSETTLITAGGANVFRDIISLVLSNESASEVRVDIRDATGGTVRLSIDLAADGGGAVISLPLPLTQATANNNWTAQLSAAVSTVYITAIAFNN